MLNRWQSTIVDAQGNVQPLANLTVRNEADQSLAKMWASPGTTQPLPDGMVQADGNGYAFFYARGGLYRITSVTLGIDWRHVQIGAALVSIGDYAAGLEITARNQIFWRDGELYRVGAVLELPYTTTGNWGDEEWLFVSLGDAALRQQLGDVNQGAALLGRGAVAVESIMDLLALPEGQRKEGLRYLVKGYHNGSDSGGGVFYYNSLRSGENDGGFVLDGFVRILNGPLVTPQMFGAVGDGVADDTAAVQAVIADGKTVHWGGPSVVYRLTSAISHTFSHSPRWRSDGAKLLLDTPSSVQTALDFKMNGNSFHLDGELMLDANMKAFIGWRLMNNSDIYADIIAVGLSVTRVFRSSTDFTGGDGVFIRGAFNRIYLENYYVKDVVMAAGAGVFGYQGVFGITIAASSATRYPRSVAFVNPYIENVYCQDIGYTFDQDGIRVMTAEDEPGNPHIYDSHFAVFGGSIINCGNRGIKSQFEQGIVVGTRFVRDSTMLPQMGRVTTNSEIDFQVGGGIVKGIECRYRSSAPISVITFQGTRTAGKFVTGGEVDGLRLSITGSLNMTHIFSVIARESSRVPMHISNVDMKANSPISGAGVIVNPNGNHVFLTLTNMRVRCTGSLVNVGNSGGTVRVSGRNIDQEGNTIPFATTGAMTSLVTNLDGLNLNVTDS